MNDDDLGGVTRAEKVGLTMSGWVWRGVSLPHSEYGQRKIVGGISKSTQGRFKIKLHVRRNPPYFRKFARSATVSETPSGKSGEDMSTRRPPVGDAPACSA